MQNILSSASKIVFILVTIGLIVLTYLKTVDAKDFVMLAAMAYAFYFSKAPIPDISTTTSTTTSQGIAIEK